MGVGELGKGGGWVGGGVWIMEGLWGLEVYGGECDREGGGGKEEGDEYGEKDGEEDGWD